MLKMFILLLRFQILETYSPTFCIFLNICLTRRTFFDRLILRGAVTPVFFCRYMYTVPYCLCPFSLRIVININQTIYVINSSFLPSCSFSVSVWWIFCLVNIYLTVFLLRPVYRVFGKVNKIFMDC